MVMNMAAAAVTLPSGVSDEGRESIVKLKEQGADEAVARLCAMKAKLRASPVSISDFDSRDWIKSVGKHHTLKLDNWSDLYLLSTR
jgi:hypothetical protein